MILTSHPALMSVSSLQPIAVCWFSRSERRSFISLRRSLMVREQPTDESSSGVKSVYDLMSAISGRLAAMSTATTVGVATGSAAGSSSVSVVSSDLDENNLLKMEDVLVSVFVSVLSAVASVLVVVSVFTVTAPVMALLVKATRSKQAISNPRAIMTSRLI